MIRTNDAVSSQRRCPSERQHSSQRLCVHLQAELEDQVQISTSFEDLCDQNVIVYLLRTKSKEYMSQVLQPLRPTQRQMSCGRKSLAMSTCP